MDHLISNGRKAGDTGARAGYADDIAVFLARSGWAADPSHLLVIDADYVLNPDFSMNGLVEHSIIIGKDTVGFHTVNPAAPSIEQQHLVRPISVVTLLRRPSDPSV